MIADRLPLLLLTLLLAGAAPAARAQATCAAEVTIERGDTLGGIAARCGTTVAALLAANPRIEDADVIYAGRTLRMPGAAATTPQRTRRPAPAPRAEPSPKRGLVVRGRLTDEGVECPALRTADGTLYTLAGGAEDFEAGDRVRVRGTVAELSFCMQGTTIAVDAIEALPDDE